MEEPHRGRQEQQQNQEQNEDSGSSSNNSKSSNYLCRQSSTRWTPTTDQIRILKDLYYNNGVRSPSAEQIQRISARLRQYGKIEGKNVFYWFQNHKARERQKKRFTVDTAMQRGVAGNGGCWKPPPSEDSIYNNKYTDITSPAGVSYPRPPSVIAVGKMGSIGYGSVFMEKSFGDCSMSSGGAGRSISSNLGRIGNGMEPCLSRHAVFDKRKSIDIFEEEAPEIETLPLFPMHGQDLTGFCTGKPSSGGHYPCWHRTHDHSHVNSVTSLQLTLSSYTGALPDSA